METCDLCGAEDLLKTVAGRDLCGDCWVYCPVCNQATPVDQTVDIGAEEEELLCRRCGR